MKIKGCIKRRKNMVVFFMYFIIANILVGGIFGTLLYLRSAYALEKETIETNSNTLIQLNKSVDLLLMQVDKYLFQLSMDSSITNFMQYYSNGDFSSQLKIDNSISNNILSNNYINSINIYFLKRNKIYSINTGILDYNDFKDREILDLIDNNNNKYFWIPSRKIYDAKTGKMIDVITVVKPAPQSAYEPDAAIIVNIDGNYLRNSMNSMITKKEMNIYVLDEKSQLVSSCGMNDHNSNISGEPYLQKALNMKSGSYYDMRGNERVLVSYTTSDMYGWKYISVIPYRVIVGKISIIKNYALLTALIAVIMGIIVSLFFSNKIFRPIQGIARLFINPEEQKHENDVIKYIENNVNQLVEKNKSIEKTLDDHMPILRNNFLTSFLYGTIPYNEETKEKFLYYGIDIGMDSSYIVYIMQFGDYRGLSYRYSERQLNMLVIYLIGLLKELVDKEADCIPVNTMANEITLIVTFPKISDEDKLKEQVKNIGENIIEAVTENVKKEVVVSVGNPKKMISEISECYNEALEAINYRMLMNINHVIFYEDIKNLKEVNFSYPYSTEKELIEAFKLGDTEVVLKKNNDFFISLNKSIDIAGDSAYYYMQLLSSIIRVSMEMGINLESMIGEKNLYMELLKCNGTAETKQWFEVLLKELSSQISMRKCKKNLKVAETIAEYIRNNCEKDLTLTTLSQQVYLSVPYLSAIFKDEFGKSLKQYINEVRMERAKELLCNPKYKVNDVAENVGYDKIHGFLRMFKEYTGMTPGQYRQSMALNINEKHEDMKNVKI